MNALRGILNTLQALPVQEDKRILTMPVASSIDESRIVVDYSVVEKWNMGWKRDLSTIEEAVVHHTEGDGDVYGLRDWMLGGEKKASYVKGIGLFHFGVSPDGTIMKFAPLARYYYHSSCGQHDKLTVGIELCHAHGPFTDAQYESLEWILFEYLSFHCPSYHRIVGHDYNFKVYSHNSKGCPGNNFDWTKLEADGPVRGFQMNKVFYQAYEIKRSA